MELTLVKTLACIGIIVLNVAVGICWYIILRKCLG